MKFRNPETGEMFDDIISAREPFCGRNICGVCPMPSSLREHSLPDDAQNCSEFCKKHPNEAATLMGYEVIPELGDDAVPAETLSGTFSKIGKGANMDKPRICEVLGVDLGEKFCITYISHDMRITKTCWIAENGDIVTDEARIPAEALSQAINHPDRIIRKPRWTEQEVERAKAIRTLWPDAKEIRVRNGPHGELEYRVCAGCTVFGFIYGDCFPTMERMKEYTLDEIIGGAE